MWYTQQELHFWITISTHHHRCIVVLDPLCEVVQPLVEGHVTLLCRMTYNWQAPGLKFDSPPNLNVSLSWNDVSETVVKTTADPATSNGTAETYMTLENAPGTIPSYNCTVQFHFSPGQESLYQYAVNPVSSTCVTEPTRVWRKYNSRMSALFWILSP